MRWLLKAKATAQTRYPRKTKENKLDTPLNYYQNFQKTTQTANFEKAALHSSAMRKNKIFSLYQEVSSYSKQSLNTWWNAFYI